MEPTNATRRVTKVTMSGVSIAEVPSSLLLPAVSGAPLSKPESVFFESRLSEGATPRAASVANFVFFVT